jgi:hypothetical protein
MSRIYFFFFNQFATSNATPVDEKKKRTERGKKENRHTPALPPSPLSLCPAVTVAGRIRRVHMYARFSGRRYTRRYFYF